MESERYVNDVTKELNKSRTLTATKFVLILDFIEQVINMNSINSSFRASSFREFVAMADTVMGRSFVISLIIIIIKFGVHYSIFTMCE